MTAGERAGMPGLNTGDKRRYSRKMPRPMRLAKITSATLLLFVTAITGATLSVNAVTRVARIALLLHEHVADAN